MIVFVTWEWASPLPVSANSEIYWRLGRHYRYEDDIWWMPAYGCVCGCRGSHFWSPRHLSKIYCIPFLSGVITWQASSRFQQITSNCPSSRQPVVKIDILLLTTGGRVSCGPPQVIAYLKGNYISENAFEKITCHRRSPGQLQVRRKLPGQPRLRRSTQHKTVVV